MQRNTRQRLRNGDEQDAIYKAPLCVFANRTGLRKYYKRVLNKRLRKAGRRLVNEQR